MAAHWLAYTDREQPPMAVSPIAAMTEQEADRWREIGARVEGPFVAADDAGAVETERERCAEIVRGFARPWHKGTPARSVLDGVLRDITTGGQ